MILSSISLIPISSVYQNVDFSYAYGNRSFTEVSAVSSYEGMSIIEFNALENVVDTLIDNNSMSFLTAPKDLSFLRTSGAQFNYYTDYTSVDVSSSIDINTNLILTTPIRSSTSFNIIPLKSQMGIGNEYDYKAVSDGTTSRMYDAIYQYPNTPIILQYKTQTVPIIFEQDALNNIILPDQISTFDINDIGFIENGAVSGNSPSNSDVIFLDQFDTRFNDYNYNGVPLCLWLSGNNWQERWYDPNTVTQGTAFITQVNTASTISPILDVPTDIQLVPKQKLSYLRHGPSRNLTYINSLSSNLIIGIDEWSDRMTFNDIELFTIPTSLNGKSYDVLNMDGSFHYHMPPTDDLLDTNDFTFGLWVNQNSWSSGIDTQYFGNFSNGEGWGLFYNTGANSNLLSLPTHEGFVYGFNPKGIKVFEKNIKQSLGLSAVDIELISTDLFGVRWLYDSANHNIYRLDTDDLIKTVVDLSSSVNISQMEVNKDNHLYVLNTTNSSISSFNSDGDLETTLTATNYNNFTFDTDNSIILSYADHLSVDSDNNIFKINGINLYKNDSLFYHIGSRVSAFRLDSSDNMYVLRKNKLLKLDSTGKKIYDITIDLPFTISDFSQEMNIIKREKNGKDYDTLWIVFNSGNYIINLDLDGSIIKRIDVKDVVNLRSCGELHLNVKGNFSNYDIKRKFEGISSTNPSITVRINLQCGISKKIVQLHYPINGLQKWVHLAFSHQIDGNSTILTLFVNGKAAVSETVSGIYFVDYGSKVSPFVIGGHSGKLGARNVERSLNNEGFFIGKIDDLRFYNRTLNNFEIRALAKNKYWDNWSDMVWFMPTPPTTQMEEIDTYHLNRYKGHKSNKYNIRIKNLTIEDDSTREIIRNTITSLLPKISPVHTQLNEVIFDN